MTNYEKLCELFPGAVKTAVQAKKICPSILRGSVLCEESATREYGGNELETEYDMRDSHCADCAGDFWNSEYREGMDINQATVQDCISMHKYKDKAVILNGGQVAGFVKEEMSEKQGGKGIDRAGKDI